MYVAEVLDFSGGKFPVGGGGGFFPGGIFPGTQEQAYTHRKQINWLISIWGKESISPVKNVYINGLIQNVMT